MATLSFLPRFAGKVRPQRNFHTIREHDNAIAVGEPLDFYHDETGKIGSGRCVARADIYLEPNSLTISSVGPDPQLLPFEGRCSDSEQLNAFARADGFESFAELVNWVRQRYKAMPFRGSLLVCRVD
jgi:hypothetical protein